jgi:hypothetical protein
LLSSTFELNEQSHNNTDVTQTAGTVPAMFPPGKCVQYIASVTMASVLEGRAPESSIGPPHRSYSPIESVVLNELAVNPTLRFAINEKRTRQNLN